MSNTMKKCLALVLVLCMAIGVLAGCSGVGKEGKGEYTYNSYTTALGTNWNPHTWETNADDTMLSYVSMPFVTMQALDTENGVYQWIYEMATSITDVTAANQGDLTKYNATLAEGVDPSSVTEGYVFEIKLNPNAKWEDGTVINADSYIYSMEQLLNPKMRNYRANLYYAGESAVAGGYTYYNSGAPIYNAVVAPYGEGEEPDYSYDLEAGINNGEVFINVNTDACTFAAYTLTDLINSYTDGSAAPILEALSGEANAYGYTKVTAENRESIISLLTAAVAPFGIDWTALDADTQNAYLMEWLWYFDGQYGEVVDYDATVGCYKVDDYTIRYVTQTAIDLNYFLTSCTSTWLVYEDLYEAGKDTSGELVTTDYYTTLENTISYGPYKMESLEADKQVVFVRNENWYGWTEEKGKLISYTPYEVDGETRERYKTTKIVIDVMDEAAAKQAFLTGALTAWTPSADELLTYATSEQLYKVDETYTMSLFFNTGVENLKTMDASKGNTNSVVLSNTNFRKAMSLAIDRAELVTATAGYKPAYAIMNNLYFYDVYNDPTSSYRGSDEAMQAVCNLYGVAYGEGTPYATLKDAYDSINGYNLTEAQALMKTACDELVAAGLYKAGEDIHVRIGMAKGSLTSEENGVTELLNKYINAALEGSGFGKFTFEAIGNINDRYGDVPKGEFAVAWGAWGGAAFYPFRNFQVYCDPDQYDVNEMGCWDPRVETLTLNVEGEDVTMTWQEWSNALIGNGPFANSSEKTKLAITAKMEEEYLNKYYRIPLAGTTACSMLAYKVSYYTEEYNIMYGFGGLELMNYNYDDAEWAKFIEDNNGTLSYE